jgi:hypothetical protein
VLTRLTVPQLLFFFVAVLIVWATMLRPRGPR